jgi:hypothetical protein
MINNSKVLMGILILVAGFAWYVIRQQASDEQLPMSALMAEWQENPNLINEVSRIELKQGDDQLLISRNDQHWVLNDGFFVNMESLFNLFQSLQTATIVEAKTANPDNHARLDLADGDLTVGIYQGEQLLKAIHLGKTSTAGHRFVRLAGEDQTYLVQDLQPVTFNEDSWTLKTVLNITAADIRAITVQPAGAASFQVSKEQDSGQWVLNDLPEGHQLKADANLDVLSQGLTRLMIDSAEQRTSDDLQPVVTLEYELVNGAGVQLHVLQQDEAHYVQISGAEWAHYEPWLMGIAPYKFDALNQSLDNFIEPVTPTESASETE